MSITRNATLARGESLPAVAVVQLALVLLIGFSSAQTGFAQTYGDAIDNQLSFNCANMLEGSLPTTDDPDENLERARELTKIDPDFLFSFCGIIVDVSDDSFSFAAAPTGSASASGSGATTVAQATLFRDRRRAARARGGTEPGGASADAVIAWGNGLSLFASGEYEILDKNNNRFEEGYDSDIARAVIGTDYELSDSLLLGVAFTYWNFDGQFKNGGGFDTDSFGGLVYASISPLDRAFVDVSLGYARKSFDQSRKVTTSIGDLDPSDPPIRTVTGLIDADFNGDEFSAGALAGYDMLLNGFFVGPRIGLQWIQTDISSYEEKGDTNVELRVDSQTETSLQGRLGMRAAWPIDIAFGILTPQAGGFWIHEFEDDQRDIDVSFVADGRSNPSEFSFETEKPDRDYGELDAGVSLLLPNGVQPYLGFRTLVGNERFDSYVFAAGVRIGL